MQRLKEPNASRIFYIKYGLQKGMGIDEIVKITRIDPWFINNIKDIVELEKKIKVLPKKSNIPYELLKEAKQYGFSDRQIADLRGCGELSSGA